LGKVASKPAIKGEERQNDDGGLNWIGASRKISVAEGEGRAAVKY
jgi:hypothetical protein